MKIVQINSVSNGSTGKIMMDIHKELINRGYDSYVVWGRGRESTSENEIFLDDKFGTYYHVLMTRLTGKTGFYSTKSTMKLIKKLEEINPDIIHLHNIHGYYVNIELLFEYLKKKKVRVIWTLHDCWPFTGQCPYFTMEKCDKWKIECNNCPMLKQYPKTLTDNSRWNYKMKKELFNGLNITIVTPSNWLAGLVKQSFLKKYDIKVINNGIDTHIYKKTKSNFKYSNNINDKKIILGVAGVWDKRKGLDDFVELSKIIDDSYIIVLIGLSKKQIKKLPNNIIGITRTENQKELVEIYSSADILFNPTYEDNYPTVNLESIACGTPVLTYDTGGSYEFTEKTNYKKNDFVIEKEKIIIDKSIIFKKIKKIINNGFVFENFDSIDNKTMVDHYIELYNECEEK